MFDDASNVYSRLCGRQRPSYCNMNAWSLYSRFRRQSECTCFCITPEYVNLRLGRLQTVKAHKHNLSLREREFHARETKFLGELAAREKALQNREAGLSTAIKHAIAAREEELRVLVQQREEEVAAAIARREEEVGAAIRRREEEIIASVNAREKEIFDAWKEREDAMEARIRWVEIRERELEEEAKRVECVKNEVEAKMQAWEGEKGKGALVSVSTER